jgi:hypothetical protein
MKKVCLSVFSLLFVFSAYAQKNEIIIDTKTYADIDFSTMEKEAEFNSKQKMKLTIRKTVPCNNACGYSYAIYSVSGRPKKVLKSAKRYCAKKVYTA